MLFSITAYAAGPVTPKTQFNYSGTDIVRSTDSLYRTENAYFKDEADVLPINTEREIWEKLQSAAEYLNIKIAVFLGGNYRTDDETIQFTIDSTYLIFGSSTDALFIYLDFEGYSPAYDYIRAFNRAEDIYPETKRNKILNKMYQNLPKSTEPIYSDAVRLGIENGLQEIKNQGYVNNTQNDNAYHSSPQNYNESKSIAKDFFSQIPKPFIIAFIIFIVVLIIISSIKNFIKRHSVSRYTNTYYDNNSYYDDGYNHRSSYHSSYRSRPPRSRPPRHHEPSHRSSSSSRRSSSDGPHSSGSGHHR